MQEDGPPVEFHLRVATGSGGPEGIGETFPIDLPDRAMEISGDETDPMVAFRRTMGMFATGVTIVTIRTGDQMHGMTANAFMSVSLQPPLVMISVDKRARMCGLLHQDRRFGISVLSEQQRDLSDRFAGRKVDIPEPVFDLVRDTPMLDGALAHIVAKVVRTYWGGDHTLFVGEVEYVRYGEGRPLLFHQGRYSSGADPMV
jgi:flavin reductase (DIM6/NTAB) family NADH-FMN oxidoreductase RutF